MEALPTPPFPGLSEQEGCARIIRPAATGHRTMPVPSGDGRLPGAISNPGAAVLRQKSGAAQEDNALRANGTFFHGFSSFVYTNFRFGRMIHEIYGKNL